MKLQELFDYQFNKGSFDDSIKPIINMVYDKLLKKYGEPISSGRNRVVFASKNFVAKLPLNDNGFYDNATEFNTYKKNKLKTDEFAKCKLIYIDDIPVLIMVKVDTSIPVKELPDWASFYDCFQVGKNKKGEFVAYDYGN